MFELNFAFLAFATEQICNAQTFHYFLSAIWRSVPNIYCYELTHTEYYTRFFVNDV